MTLSPQGRSVARTGLSLSTTCGARWWCSLRWRGHALSRAAALWQGYDALQDDRGARRRAVVVSEVMVVVEGVA
jgi:hypothetical protein